jgi:hypothetical protein
LTIGPGPARTVEEDSMETVIGVALIIIAAIEIAAIIRIVGANSPRQA